MAKVEFVEHFRQLIGGNDARGWTLMNEAAGLFELLCISGENTMPDDEIMRQGELGDAAAMWAYIISVQGQAEAGGAYHHDYADAVAVTLLATARALEDKPDSDENVLRFTTLFNVSPKEFIERFA